MRLYQRQVLTDCDLVLVAAPLNDILVIREPIGIAAVHKYTRLGLADGTGLGTVSQCVTPLSHFVRVNRTFAQYIQTDNWRKFYLNIPCF